MLRSGIIDFAIGIVFTFLAISLAAGAATEALSSALKIRSKRLLKGIKDLLNTDVLVAELYKHALINPRANGSTSSTKERAPAYIPSEQFAAAFVEIIKGLPDPQTEVTAPAAPPGPAPAAVAAPDPTTVEQHKIQDWKAKVDQRVGPTPTEGNATNLQIRNMLHGMIDRAKGNEEEFRKQLAAWFDNSMDRVSGAYKRWAQLCTFILAFLIAAVLNVSTIDVARSIWRQPVDLTQITAVYDPSKTPDATKADLKQTLDMLERLPVGWPIKYSAEQKKTDVPDLYTFVFGAQWDWEYFAGWIITAFATLFGAPFWFDALQRVVRLKGAGPSPAEKAKDLAAAK